MTSAEPLRDRLPAYGAWLVIELAAAAVIGLVVWWLSDLGLAPSLGWALVAVGGFSLLAGGMGGGGFVTAGDYGIAYGRRHRRGWDSTR